MNGASEIGAMEIGSRDKGSTAASGEWLQAVFEHAFQFIGVLSPDGTVLHANPSSLRSAGFVEDQVVGRLFWETPWWSHSPRLQERLRSAISHAASGQGDRFEATHPTADGPPIHVDFSITPVKDATGKVIWLIPEGRDITKLREHQMAIQRRDARLERLLDAALRLNAEHELGPLLQSIANAARDVIGCRYSALGILSPGKDALENFVVSGMSEEQVEQLGALPTGKGVLGLLIRHHDPIRLSDLSSHHESSGFPPGHPVMSSFLGVPVLGRRGAIGNLYFTEKDGGHAFDEEDEALAKMLAAAAAVAVENARLMTEMRNLQRSRDQFYAMVNHELRNAITGVYGWSELLLRKNPDDRTAIEIVESTEYTIELMNDLLDLSRLDAERLELRIAHQDICAVLDEAVRTVEPLAQKARIAIVTDYVEPPIHCETDAKRVKQIAINLLRNAVRHGDGQSVTLKVFSDEERVIFQVVDRGEGLSPEQQAIIFDAYMRAGSKVGGGTGLGLTVCARLARLLGGDIAVRSAPGEGATFTVHVARSLKR